MTDDMRTLFANPAAQLELLDAELLGRLPGLAKSLLVIGSSRFDLVSVVRTTLTQQTKTFVPGAARIRTQTATPGGASIPALVWKDLGGVARLVSYTGNDTVGTAMREQLGDLDTPVVFLLPTVPTPAVRSYFRHENAFGFPAQLPRQFTAEKIGTMPDIEHQFTECFKEYAKEGLPRDLAEADAVIVLDYGTGVINKDVVSMLCALVGEEKARRRDEEDPRRLLVVVVPDTDWRLIGGLGLDLLVCSFEKTCQAIDVPYDDEKLGELDQIDEVQNVIAKDYSLLSPQFVITAGSDGFFSMQSSDSGMTCDYFRSVPKVDTISADPDRCREFFTTLLTSSMAMGVDVHLGLALAAAGGSLQAAADPGTTVKTAKLLSPTTAETLQLCGFFPGAFRRHIPDEREEAIRKQLRELFDGIDYRTALFRSERAGETRLIAASSGMLATMAELERLLIPHSVIFIDGESGSGKSQIARELERYFDGYSYGGDCFLDGVGLAPEAVEGAFDLANRLGTCLVVEEVHLAKKDGLGTLLRKVQDNGHIEEEFCLILLGHEEQMSGEKAREDLLARCESVKVLSLCEAERLKDIPYLAAFAVADKESANCGSITGIEALALRELMRCDFRGKEVNFRGLAAAIRASCQAAAGSTITWEAIDVSHANGKKPDTRPRIDDDLDNAVIPVVT